MEDKILVDTSIWLDFFKLKPEAGKKLENLLIGNSVITCGIVMFELLQGIRYEKEKTIILKSLSILPYIEMTDKLWQASAELSSSLKKKGYNLPLSDILIAAIAIEHNLSVFTLDKHFKQIPGVKLYKA